jgi:hypothetical protein
VQARRREEAMSSGAVMNGGGGSSSRGTKRAADESNLNDLERFEKRLRLLSLRTPLQLNYLPQRRRLTAASGERENGRRRLYTPVSNHEPSHEAAAQARSERRQRRANHVRQQDQDEHMQLDDRPDRVYIHDLDAELASDSESDSEKLIFLPDIEKRFSRIPQQVLRGGGEGNQELVLYSVPKSISVGEGHDSVRKAIIEARSRAREKAVEDAKARQEVMDRQYDQSSVVDGVERAHGYSNGYHDGGQAQSIGGQELDPDAMDID